MQNEEEKKDPHRKINHSKFNARLLAQNKMEIRENA
jgi:hypothetical protein